MLLCDSQALAGPPPPSSIAVILPTPSTPYHCPHHTIAHRYFCPHQYFPHYFPYHCSHRRPPLTPPTINSPLSPLTALCPHVRHQLFLMILLLSVVHKSCQPPFTKCSGVVVCEGNSDLPNCKTLSSMPENYTQCNNFCCPLSRFYYSADPLLSAADLHNT